jgi:hypothetical protein
MYQTSDGFNIPIDLPNYSPLEITLPRPENFLKVKETLTRVGVEAKGRKVLYQSCHILHKRQKYYIMSFKELFALDNKLLTITEEDIERRNTIALLLAEWNLLTIVNPMSIMATAPMANIKIIPFTEKAEWQLISKYTVGNKKTLTNKA